MALGLTVRWASALRLLGASTEELAEGKAVRENVRMARTAASRKYSLRSEVKDSPSLNITISELKSFPNSLFGRHMAMIYLRKERRLEKSEK